MEKRVSNFNAQQLLRLFDNIRIKPACHEMEFHPTFCRFELLKLCTDLNISVFAYCPLGQPKPEKQEPKFFYDQKVQEVTPNTAKPPQKSQYASQSSPIPIPKSATRGRLAENNNVFDFHLADDEVNVKTFHSDENQICLFQFAKDSKYYVPVRLKYPDVVKAFVPNPHEIKSESCWEKLSDFILECGIDSCMSQPKYVESRQLCHNNIGNSM